MVLSGSVISVEGVTRLKNCYIKEQNALVKICKTHMEILIGWIFL
jgi:hypothetical protein